MSEREKLDPTLTLNIRIAVFVLDPVTAFEHPKTTS
jgi:hypothetical protein